MADLTVIVPSRGRPDSVRELAAAFHATCTASTELVVAVDDNDPMLAAYHDTVLALPGTVKIRPWVCEVVPPSSMVRALNAVATFAVCVGDVTPFAVGFMGDDHRPRTPGWDAAYLEALRELGTGIVYGDDLFQGRRLPTQCAMSADIVRELGYMAPPSLTHLAVDNYWLELGTKGECIRYRPDVVIEHRHPAAGKAPWDEGYQRVNAPEMYDRDLTELARLQQEELPRDIAKVRALRGAHV